MHSTAWLFVYTSLNFSLRQTDARTYDNRTSLKRTLLTGYDKDVIPVLNQSHEFNVTVVFSLITIPEVDSVNSVIKLRAFLYFSWIDEKVTWFPEEYGNISVMSFPATSVWTPPIFLGSGVTLENIVNTWQKVYIKHDGFSNVVLGGTFTSFCGFSMAFWPFDKQACSLYFVSSTSEEEKINFVLPSHPVHDLNFIPMGQWTYDKISASYVDRFDGTGKDIIYTIKIRRQSAFYILTLILPMHCVSILGLLVFLIPCSSGERVGFSVTIMLSMVVFMMVVKDEVPKTSEPLPYMCIFINISVFGTFLVTIMNIFSMNLYFRDDTHPVGQKYERIVNLSIRLNEKISAKPVDVENIDQDDILNCAANKTKAKVDSPGTVENAGNSGNNDTDFLSRQNVKQKTKVTWKDISQAIDRLTLVTVMPLSMVCMILSAVYLMTASDYPDWSN